MKKTIEEQLRPVAAAVAVRGAETFRWLNRSVLGLHRKHASCHAQSLIGGVIDNLFEADACFSLTRSLSLITSLVSRK